MNNLKLNAKLISSLNNVLFMQSAQIIVDTDIKKSTWYHIVQTPEIISIQQLLAIANGLHIPVRRFFTTDKVFIIGRREDYIIDPYIPCRYDGAKLQQLVNERPDATWQKAAKATGITYSRLKDSVLAVTRTPVTRFLLVCDVFDIDPFTILIDPNPEPKPKQAKPDKKGSNDALLTEISTMRQNISALNDTIGDLTNKYQSLLDAYKTLLERVDRISDNDSPLGIAADPLINRDPDNS